MNPQWLSHRVIVCVNTLSVPSTRPASVDAAQTRQIVRQIASQWRS